MTGVHGWEDRVEPGYCPGRNAMGGSCDCPCHSGADVVRHDPYDPASEPEIEAFLDDDVPDGGTPSVEEEL